MSRDRERYARRRKIARDHEGEVARVTPESAVGHGALHKAKQGAHQKMRRLLHALLNALPGRHQSAADSAWMTTTTDDALAGASHIRGAANADIRRAQVQPSWESLRARLNHRLDPPAAPGCISPPDGDD